MAPHHCRSLKLSSITFILILITGGHSQLTVMPIGSTLVNALAGTNVTLQISFSGADAPVVTWRLGTLPVATLIIGTNSSLDIAPALETVLTIEQNGALTFRKVPANYSGTYTVEVLKSGTGEASVSFTLQVYDIIRSVSVGTAPSEAVEGQETFTLFYATMQGEPEEVTWQFSGVMLQNGSRYSISGRNLMIKQPNREDTGRYTVVLRNPFSSETQHRNITVLYGPDEPVLVTSPTKGPFVSRESISLSCTAAGEPGPTATWFYKGQALSTSTAGTLNLTNVHTNQSGIYTCVLANTVTGAQRAQNITINIYERPEGDPVCSVQAVSGTAALQYRCLWPGGNPEAQLSFPTLSESSKGDGDLNMTASATPNLNGVEVICMADHPLVNNQCGVTAHGPADFIPLVSSILTRDESVTVSIQCFAAAVPPATVLWFREGQSLQSGVNDYISDNTTLLLIHDIRLSTTRLDSYTCQASNPLANKSRDIQLLGPVITESSVSPNEDDTAVTLTWDVPVTAIITGFEIQMQGPALSMRGSARPDGRADDGFSTIQTLPASSRSTYIPGLDPETTYHFQVVPKAGQISGTQSQRHRVGPDEGLSGPAIAGIAAGIPCSILFLSLLIGLIFLCIFCHRRRNHSIRYPVSRTVEKAVGSQSNLNGINKLLTAGLKQPPDYSQHQAVPERSNPLPSANMSVRMATTV